MTYSKPLPNLEDLVAAPFWVAARESRLSVQRCSKCQYLRWPPAPICPECLEAGGVWVDLRGEGEIWSYAIYHRAMSPAFADDVPYAVAMITLSEGLEMIGRISGSFDDIHIGQKVKVIFEPVTIEATLVLWELLRVDILPPLAEGASQA